MKIKFLLFIFFVFFLSRNSAEIIFNDQETILSNDSRELYIDLIKKILANTIYQDQSCYVFSGRSFKKDVPYDAKIREFGLDWPALAHTMIGRKRLDNIHECAINVLKNGIPGDFIETGVWRGGATILMRAILKAYQDTTRIVWVADSFAGLPQPNPEKYPMDLRYDLSGFAELAVSLDQVQENFRKYDLLDHQVVFLKGLFSETLPKAPIESISLLRLDGDLYESTMDALIYLYPKLSVGGYIIIDDYKIPSCKAAVRDYRATHQIVEKINRIDKDGIFWKKEQ